MTGTFVLSRCNRDQPVCQQHCTSQRRRKAGRQAGFTQHSLTQEGKTKGDYATPCIQDSQAQWFIILLSASLDTYALAFKPLLSLTPRNLLRTRCDNEAVILIFIEHCLSALNFHSVFPFCPLQSCKRFIQGASSTFYPSLHKCLQKKVSGLDGLLKCQVAALEIQPDKCSPATSQKRGNTFYRTIPIVQKEGPVQLIRMAIVPCLLSVLQIA